MLDTLLQDDIRAYAEKTELVHVLADIMHVLADIIEKTELVHVLADITGVYALGRNSSQKFCLSRPTHR